MVVYQDAWSEMALISIASSGQATDTEFAAFTETIDIDRGDKDIDAVVNVKGGRIVKKIPEDMTTVTFEAYPIDIGVTSGLSQQFNRTYDVAQPLSSTNTFYRDKMRVAILWTDDITATSGAGAVASGSQAYRFTAKNGYITSSKPSFTDGVLKFTFQFKFPPFIKTGTGNITEESTDSSAAITALGTYTAT